MTKTLYCIRHGIALHNVLFKNIGEMAYIKHRDTKLVEQGIEQAKNLGKKWQEKDNIDLVVVSPLTRTLETATHIFNNSDTPIIAIDSLKEYPQATQECNHRRTVMELKTEFTNINFNEILQNKDQEWRDLIYNDDFEIKKLKHRISSFKTWIKNRPENKIAVVGHSSYLNMMLNGFVDDETNELKHCHPYKYYI